MSTALGVLNAYLAAIIFGSTTIPDWWLPAMAAIMLAITVILVTLILIGKSIKRKLQIWAEKKKRNLSQPTHHRTVLGPLLCRFYAVIALFQGMKRRFTDSTQS